MKLHKNHCGKNVMSNHLSANWITCTPDLDQVVTVSDTELIESLFQNENQMFYFLIVWLLISSSLMLGQKYIFETVSPKWRHLQHLSLLHVAILHTNTSVSDSLHRTPIQKTLIIISHAFALILHYSMISLGNLLLHSRAENC